MQTLHPVMAQAIAPFISPKFGQTPVGHFTSALANGYKPSAAEMRDLAYELQGVIANCDEIQWMHTSFEAVGDAIHQAMKHTAWANEFCSTRTKETA